MAQRRPSGKKRPEPSTTRTNRDLKMIVMGALLIIFFLVAGYLGIRESARKETPTPKGPVRNPHSILISPPSQCGGKIRVNRADAGTRGRGRHRAVSEGRRSVMRTAV